MTNDVVVNLALPNGLVLSGSVRTERGDPVALGTLTARSTTGMFAASIQGGDSSYRIALPAGTYDLNLSIPFLDADETEIPTFVYMASDVVAGLGITADTTQDLVVPNLPDLGTVTGFVTLRDAVPTTGALRFVSTDGTTFSIVLFEDFYTARLPLNTYNVSAALTFTEAAGATSPRTTAKVIVDPDAVTVNDDPMIYDVALPATVDLSGTVLDGVGAPLAPARVVATAAEADITVPSEIDFSCRPEAAFSLVPIPVSGSAFLYHDMGEGSTAGTYHMPLPIGAYRLGVTLGLDLQPGMVPTLVELDTSPHSIIHIFMSEVALTTDVAQNLAVPDLPPVVMVSGLVTDTLGQPVANAAVVAMTSALVGVSNTVRFLAEVQTQDDGSYRLPVLSGTSYAIKACPPGLR
ncbi:carboxypeptidase-like regulatory domain-containing protein [Candidatus Entotheonella palauensis]|uniref:carboxypeptidase-like regulatory domain-containing protein n=1 Tax=Candidatus Entotheonella palauensis TaxID=93172 RepID=UPI001178C451|nr:carboxypeptidase-like regulatory domain-containing protein [Candidatus Entotheonella palauensis]